MFNWRCNGSHWFVGSFNRLSTGYVLAVFNRFSTGRSDWLAVVFHAVMAILPEALTGIEGLGEDGGDLLVDGDDLGAHRGDLCLSTRGGDGGVEEEGHVEHLALQQQPGSLLHLVVEGDETNVFQDKLQAYTAPQEA